jgi:hypothetical protein
MFNIWRAKNQQLETYICVFPTITKTFDIFDVHLISFENLQFFIHKLYH